MVSWWGSICWLPSENSQSQLSYTWLEFRTVEMQVSFSVRRLTSDDVDLFKDVRQEMFRDQPREFRFDPEDERSVSREQVVNRIASDYIVAAFHNENLVAVGGFTRFSGIKLNHRGLIWGMYARPTARGTGAASVVMRALLDHAAETVELVTLTVIASNPRAVRFYERWGFRVFGTEPRSVKLRDGSYLDENLMALSLANYRTTEGSLLANSAEFKK